MIKPLKGVNRKKRLGPWGCRVTTYLLSCPHFFFIWRYDLIHAFQRNFPAISRKTGTKKAIISIPTLFFESTVFPGRFSRKNSFQSDDRHVCNSDILSASHLIPDFVWCLIIHPQDFCGLSALVGCIPVAAASLLIQPLSSSHDSFPPLHSVSIKAQDLHRNVCGSRWWHRGGGVCVGVSHPSLTSTIKKWMLQFLIGHPFPQASATIFPIPLFPESSLCQNSSMLPKVNSIPFLLKMQSILSLHSHPTLQPTFACSELINALYSHLLLSSPLSTAGNLAEALSCPLFLHF